jgi:hypothetical protein
LLRPSARSASPLHPNDATSDWESVTHERAVIAQPVSLMIPTLPSQINAVEGSVITNWFAFGRPVKRTLNPVVVDDVGSVYVEPDIRPTMPNCEELVA